MSSLPNTAAAGPLAASSSPRLASEIRRTGLQAGPLVIGHLATASIGFVDSVIAGHHGTATLAAVSVGTALFWLPMMVPMGTLMSLPPAVSQLAGSGRRDEIGALFRQALWLSLALGLALFAFLSVVGAALEPMGIAPDIRHGARGFLDGIRWGVPALTFYLCMRYLCDGLHWTLPTMLFGFGGLLVLVPLGFALTYGAFGLPERGAAGLGIASALMMWMQALAFLWYLRRSRRLAGLGLFARRDAPRWAPIRELLVTGLPIGVTVAMEGGLFITTALLIGRLGELPVAAHQIAINVASLCYMIPLGLAEATVRPAISPSHMPRGPHAVVKPPMPSPSTAPSGMPTPQYASAAITIGTRVSRRPRNAPEAMTWMPSGNWNAAAYSSNPAASAATCASPV
jgi:MATE family multidrug resistance protein